jgi:type IV secretion system protein VirD4
MSTGKGLQLGHFYDESTGHFGPRRVFEGDQHGFVCAPSGTGKSTRLIAVALLSDNLDDRSVVVIDPKGELALTCMAWRHQLGHDVVLIDPYGVVKEQAEAKPDAYRYLLDNGMTESIGFNPLRSLKVGDYDGAAQLADALIKIEGLKEPHWSESAQGFGAGLIMWELRKKRPTLENIRKVATEPDVHENVAGEDGTKETQLVRGLTVTAREAVDTGGYEIASLLGRFAGRATNEILSIRSTFDTQTRWLLSKPMRVDTGKTGFSFAQLKERPTSVFIVLPSDLQRANSAWTRMLIVFALRALSRPGGVRTVMFIDELPVLGTLQPLIDAYAVIRSAGTQIVGFIQNLDQIKSRYQDWPTMLANSGFVQFMRPGEMTTSEWMSRRSGQATVLAKGLSESAGSSAGGASERESTSWNQVGRPKYLPHELFGLEPGTGLLWLAGLAHTIKFYAPGYYELAQCAKRALPNPYYRP